jgi:hypothetical protein
MRHLSHRPSVNPFGHRSCGSGNCSEFVSRAPEHIRAALKSGTAARRRCPHRCYLPGAAARAAAGESDVNRALILWRLTIFSVGPCDRGNPSLRIAGRRGEVGRDEGQKPAGQCWTKSADDWLRAGDTQPLERKPAPICPGGDSTADFGPKSYRKAVIPASLSRKSDAKVTQKCATCRIRHRVSLSGSSGNSSEFVARAAEHMRAAGGRR